MQDFPLKNWISTIAWSDKKSAITIVRYNKNIATPSLWSMIINYILYISFWLHRSSLYLNGQSIRITSPIVIFCLNTYCKYPEFFFPYIYIWSMIINYIFIFFWLHRSLLYLNGQSIRMTSPIVKFCLNTYCKYTEFFIPSSLCCLTH